MTCLFSFCKTYKYFLEKQHDLFLIAFIFVTRSHCVALAGLELQEICLPVPLMLELNCYWDCFFFPLTQRLYVAPAVLEVHIEQTGLELRRSACFCLQSASYD